MARTICQEALLNIGAVAATLFMLLAMTHHSLEVVLFEALPAFGTVWPIHRHQADLPPTAHILLIVPMFLDRVGP